MWVQELPNGKYKFNERYKDPVTGSYRYVSVTNIRNNRNVAKSMQRILDEKIQKKIASAPYNDDITLSELLDRWYEVYESTVRPSTARGQRTRIKHIKSELGHYKTSQLNATLLNQFLLSLTRQGQSYTNVSFRKQTLSMVLKFAKKYGYLKDDFTHLLSVEKVNLPAKNELKYLEAHELADALSQLEAMGYQEIANLCKIQALTGMRIGELLALDYRQHIDLDNRTIDIVATWDSILQRLGPPKTGDARTININQDVAETIKRQIALTQRKVISHRRITSDNTLLFVSNRGTHKDYRQVNAALAKVKIEGKHVTTHYFRHTFVTIMLENNVPIKQISQHVGHTDTAMVEKVYSHFSQKMADNLRSSIDQLQYAF